MSALLVLRLIGALADPQDTTSRTAGWRGDLQILLTEARRIHAAPKRPAHEPAFGQAVERLTSRVPRLSNERMVAEVQRLLAMLQDGHSLVYLVPAPRAPISVLPIDMYLFADGLFIVGGLGEHARLTGSRVTQMGGRRVEDLLRGLEPYVSRDNAIALKAFGPVYLTVPAFLEAQGVSLHDGQVELTLSEPTGRERTVSITPGPARRHPRTLGPPVGSSAPPPMYLENIQSPFWMRRLPEHQAVYFQFSQVRNAEGASLAGFAQRLADALSAPDVRHVIVDLRHNNGGNNMLLAPLIETLTTFERARSGNRIFVLTSRTTFSAAQNFINRLERAAHPVFAGEPSMSSPNFTGEDNEVVLPYSGLRVSISNRYWQDSDPNDMRPWIEIQLPAPLSSGAYFANRDPVLPVVFQAIAGERR